MWAYLICFLIRFRLCIFGRNITEEMCHSQCTVSGDTWCHFCPISSDNSDHMPSFSTSRVTFFFLKIKISQGDTWDYTNIRVLLNFHLLVLTSIENSYLEQSLLLQLPNGDLLIPSLLRHLFFTLRKSSSVPFIIHSFICSLTPVTDS